MRVPYLMAMGLDRETAERVSRECLRKGLGGPFPTYSTILDIIHDEVYEYCIHVEKARAQDWKEYTRMEVRVGAFGHTATIHSPGPSPLDGRAGSGPIVIYFDRGNQSQIMIPRRNHWRDWTLSVGSSHGLIDWTREGHKRGFSEFVDDIYREDRT